MNGLGSEDHARARRRFFCWAALIVALGLVLRLYFVAATQVDYPIRGDIREYANYAWNMVHRGVFSMASPEAVVAKPDSYRGPGYPLFLAAFLQWGGGHWYGGALLAQCLLATLTIALSMALARAAMSSGAALVVGVAIALWPHLISFAGTLLSETLFGFLIALALWLTCHAWRRPARALAVAAGVSWGAAALVNPVALPLPLLAALVFALDRRRSAAVFLLAAGMALPLAWSLRNASLENRAGGLRRAETNFVQGSWPQYHAAENARFKSAIARSIVAAINEEARLLQADPVSGLRHISQRMARDPGYYAAWYLLRKPYLLWAWSVRLGHGDIYFLEIRHSPFERQPLLRAVEIVARTFNPLVFGLALITVSWVMIFRIESQRKAPFEVVVVAGFCVYVTLVHTVLQAEPRYSVAYRPQELLLAVMGATLVVRRVREYVRKVDEPGNV